MGPDWLSLCPSIRRAHCDGCGVRGTGLFAIRHGTEGLSKLAAKMFGMPPETEAAPTRLSITTDGANERWERDFDGRRLVTRQYDAGGLLAEQFGLLELRFRLRAVEGALTYVPAAAYLRMGRSCLRIPKWLAPRVWATEQPCGDQTQVTVEVDLPLIGRLISYEGLLTIEDP